MHVLITADTVGGVWTYTRELVTGLSQRGVRVTLVSFGDMPSAEQNIWMNGLAGVDYRPTAFPLEWMQGAEPDVAESKIYLESVIREVEPDVLHLNQYAYSDVAPEYPRVVVAHSDVISWSLAVNGEGPAESSWLSWYRETVNNGLGKADVVVAPSQWMLDAVVANYVRPVHSMVIHNGRRAEEFTASPAKEPFVLTVGRLWDQGKQVSLLAAADHAIPICIVGSEDHPESQHRGALGFTTGRSCLKLLGRQSQEQLRVLYGQASTYAATSCYEPFGLAPLEAALSRCALVANDIPVFHELWEDSAYYFRRNDPESLAAAIRDLNDNPKLRRDYADRAYERAHQQFRAESMCAKYESLYHTLIAKERARDAAA